MATIGRGAAIADFGRVYFKGWFAWVLWWAVHIYFLIGFRNRVMVFLNWAWAYVTYSLSARLITGAESGRRKERSRSGLTDEREIRSEEHTSELQSLMRISYAVFCLKKKRLDMQNYISVSHTQNDIYSIYTTTTMYILIS